MFANNTDETACLLAMQVTVHAHLQVQAAIVQLRGAQTSDAAVESLGVVQARVHLHLHYIWSVMFAYSKNKNGIFIGHADDSAR